MHWNKSIFVFLLLVVSSFSPLEAQHLKGNIIDEATNEPLAFATIYLNTTSIGTNSNASGNFRFEIPRGEHEVVVQFIGYQSLTFKINSQNIAENYQIKLLKEALELASVKITGERDKEWYDNLEIFKKNFLGTSKSAIKCEILNEKSLIIDFNPETATLKVIGTEPLQIFNPMLGYTLEYSLIEFTYELQKGKLFFAGYPYFKMNSLSKRQIKKVAKNREKAYLGSIPHLIKSLLNNEVTEQGFRIMNLKRIPNPERPTEAELKAAGKDFLNSEVDQVLKDSLRTYVLSKAKLPKMIEILDTTALSGADLIVKKEEGIYLEVENLLQIVYTKEKEEPRYVSYVNAKKASPQTTILHILNGKEKLNPAGDVTNPSNILWEEYMAWEKIGDLMPLDYSSPK